MFDQRSADVPKMSHHLAQDVPQLVPQTSRGRPHLELVNICCSRKKPGIDM